MDEQKPRNRAEYQRERRKQSTDLYFGSPEELEAFREMSRQAGYGTLNKYILHLVRIATSGNVYPPDYVEGLKANVEKLEKRLEAARDENQDYRAESRGLSVEKDILISMMLGLPQGNEAVSKFFEQRTSGKAVS